MRVKKPKQKIAKRPMAEVASTAREPEETKEPKKA